MIAYSSQNLCMKAYKFKDLFPGFSFQKQEKDR